MKQWLALNGNFTEKDRKIIFHGGSMVPSNDISNTTSSLGKFGMLLFEDMLSNGEIEATVEFESFDKSDEAEILFNLVDCKIKLDT